MGPASLWYTVPLGTDEVQKGATMPKEVIYADTYNDEESSIGVHWYSFDDPEARRIVSVSIGTDEPFSFLDDPNTDYDSLYFTFTDPAQIDRFMKHLRRAKRKAFGDSR